MKMSTKSDGRKKRKLSSEMIEYAARCIKKSFLWGLLFMILFRIVERLMPVIPNGIPRVIWYVVAMVFLTISFVLLMRMIFQLWSSVLATTSGTGWHEGCLTDKQLKRSVYAVGVKERSYYGCTYVYWNGWFMKRYLEDVK